MRINKYIAACGVASRRKCEDLIKNGQIKVNGQVVTNLATDINEKKDKVEFDGKVIAPPKGFVYIKLNKPKAKFLLSSEKK